VGRAEKPGLRRGGQAELRGMGLAEDDEAGLLEAHDHFRVLIGNELAKSAGAEGGDCAGIKRRAILEQVGHAGERTRR
jgi:hypothetical protein